MSGAAHISRFLNTNLDGGPLNGQEILQIDKLNIVRSFFLFFFTTMELGGL